MIKLEKITMTILDSHLHFHCIKFSFVPQCNL